MSQSATYVVTGMTCEHCVRSVEEEVGDVAGVADVAVDLVSGSVRVTSDRPIDDAAVKAAVEEAGYAVT
jgi:copper chaperone